MLHRTVILILLLLTGFSSLAQTDTIRSTVPDSVLQKMHSPTKATIMSALLPGLGQAYNKKYWKIPIIYAGFGVMTYFIVTNSSEYHKYKEAYIESANHDSTGQYWYLVQKYTPENLVSARDYYLRNLEISVMLTGVWYILNILDATVDAHLFTYTINDELSLKVEPVVIPSVINRNVTTGIKLCLKF